MIRSAPIGWVSRQVSIQRGRLVVRPALIGICVGPGLLAVSRLDSYFVPL